jgi:PleD family two-component response regulator
MNEEVRIVIVDDDPDVLFSTERALKRDGYTIKSYTSPEEFKSELPDFKPDLVLMDVVMPDISGIDLCQQVKSMGGDNSPFIVLLSGSRTSSDDQAEGLELGADGYIPRPIENRELRARVKSMVRILLAERERDRLIAELREAMAEIRKLAGLLPICAHCKSIRDDKGYWQKIEAYLSEHTGARTSHGICPGCLKEHYPEFCEEEEEK